MDPGDSAYKRELLPDCNVYTQFEEEVSNLKPPSSSSGKGHDEGQLRISMCNTNSLEERGRSSIGARNQTRNRKTDDFLTFLIAREPKYE